MSETLTTSVLFVQNYNATASVVVNQGGSNSGKTFAILQALFSFACTANGQVITVVAQDVPNLKSGAIRDAQNIVASSPALQAALKSYNKTDRVFQFYNGSIIECKSYADGQDAKSGKRDYLFINEANGVTWEVYTELALRTRKRVYIDYNPNVAFWVHDNLIGNPDVQLIISDHRHNPFITEHQRKKIEGLKTTDEGLWKVYARGLTGKVTGLVLPNWQVCEDIPPDAKVIAAGLDFGYTNDETGCVMVYKQDGALWIDELLYETGLTNPDISIKLTEAGLNRNIEIVADSAEPKSIEELRRLGWNIKGAKKGPDSVKVSIDILKRYALRVTRRSVNLRFELSRYIWKKDRTGRTLNEPADTLNHLIDPLRYIALNKLNTPYKTAVRTRLPAKPERQIGFAAFNLLK